MSQHPKSRRIWKSYLRQQRLWYVHFTGGLKGLNGTIFERINNSIEADEEMFPIQSLSSSSVRSLEKMSVSIARSSNLKKKGVLMDQHSSSKNHEQTWTRKSNVNLYGRYNNVCRVQDPTYFWFVGENLIWEASNYWRIHGELILWLDWRIIAQSPLERYAGYQQNVTSRFPTYVTYPALRIPTPSWYPPSAPIDLDIRYNYWARIRLLSSVSQGPLITSYVTSLTILLQLFVNTTRLSFSSTHHMHNDSWSDSTSWESLVLYRKHLSGLQGLWVQKSKLLWFFMQVIMLHRWESEISSWMSLQCWENLYKDKPSVKIKCKWLELEIPCCSVDTRHRGNKGEGTDCRGPRINFFCSVTSQIWHPVKNGAWQLLGVVSKLQYLLRYGTRINPYIQVGKMVIMESMWAIIQIDGLLKWLLPWNRQYSLFSKVSES